MLIDKSDMLSVIRNFPKQCKEAMNLPQGLNVKGDIKKIFVAGMGGSGLGGELLKSYMINSKIPVFPVKDYSLPGYADENSLVFAVSYSGNTEETISAFHDARKKNCKIIAITSGGELAKISDKLIKVPSGMQPRAALGYLFFPMLGVLHNANLLDVHNDELKEMLCVDALLPRKVDVRSLMESINEIFDKG